MTTNDTVLFRAASGPEVGIGHAMRARAVAEEVQNLGGRPRFVLDDEETAAFLADDGFDARSEGDDPDWADVPAAGAWLDGFCDWTPRARALVEAGTPIFLVENRTAARALCHRVVYPALHHRPDAWDLRHAARVLAGASWIPLSRDVVETSRATTRDVDVLVTFGGSDPLHTTERVLTALASEDLRVVVAVGPHMASRRRWIERLASDSPRTKVLSTGIRLAPWMARSRMAVTALGTTLYELAHLGTPALIVANYVNDREAMAHYAAHGPHLPIGVSDELTDAALQAALRSGRACLAAGEPPVIEGLGQGARALATMLLRGEARVDAPGPR